uniref:HhH-GPD superfamily base excision DNA repair protein n=1 Tax=Pithovirus LCPAC404 TaxID=2506597 RepID=A0A481ZFZ8_9VIRU|nr:MAG: HhH-GPD superfamily base excision DNA repair protein [Pithovirus LCPAC404]
MNTDKLLLELNRLYPNADTEVAWDNEGINDLYVLCTAVVLSPMTTEKIVEKIIKHLYDEDLHRPENVLKNQERVKEIVKPAGFTKRKPKYVIEMAEKFHFDEKWTNIRKDPKTVTFKDLLTFKGIGPKCAAVIQCCLGYLPDIFPVDTHVGRCARRWGLTTNKNPNLISKDLQKLFPKDKWRLIHFQIVMIGRYICTAKKHKSCEMCDMFNTST